jgi:hypothetical protein
VEIKHRLDSITEGYKLYKTDRHRSTAYVELLARRRRDIAAGNKVAAKSTTAEIKALTPDEKVTVTIGDGLSNDRIAKWLYGEMGEGKRHKKGRVTADEIALRRVRLATRNDTVKAVIDLILEHRKCEKLASYVDVSKLGPDGRMHSFYKVSGTDTGRLASASFTDATDKLKGMPVLGVGANLQNQTIKHVFVPDA